MTIKSAEIFEKMRPAMEKAGADLCKKIGAVYLFEIKPNKDSAAVLYTVDLKNGNGKHY
jgi:hypothetical protein